MRNIFDGFNSLFMNDSRLLKTDIEEMENSYQVTVEVPGVSKDNVAIDFTEDTLTVSVKAAENSNKAYVRRERYSASGSRSFYLKDVDDESIKAKMDNGLLIITINKKKPAVDNSKINISIE